MSLSDRKAPRFRSRTQDEGSAVQLRLGFGGDGNITLGRPDDMEEKDDVSRNRTRPTRMTSGPSTQLVLSGGDDGMIELVPSESVRSTSDDLVVGDDMSILQWNACQMNSLKTAELSRTATNSGLMW